MADDSFKLSIGPSKPSRKPRATAVKKPPAIDVTPWIAPAEEPEPVDMSAARTWLAMCPACSFESANCRERPDTKSHYAELRCPSCNHFRWLPRPMPDFIEWPWTIVRDTREQLPYKFDGLWSGPAERSPRLIVNSVTGTLKTGDYSLLEHPKGVIERKSKADLYGSMNNDEKRTNFVGRLERMCGEFDFCAVVVEASWEELATDPPPHTKFTPKSLIRTIQSYMVKYYPIHWVCVPGRTWGENFTFRLLEKYAQFRQTIQQGKWEDRDWEWKYIQQEDPAAELDGNT